MQHTVGWELKIETGRLGQIVAAATLSGDLSVASISEVKSFLLQLIDAECDSKLNLADVTAVDASFFQIWYSFARTSIEKSFCTQLDLQKAENVTQQAKKLGFNNVALFQQCLLSEDKPAG